MASMTSTSLISFLSSPSSSNQSSSSSSSSSTRCADPQHVLEKNDQGSWYNYKLDRVNELTKDIESMMLEARAMYQSVSKGEVKMAAASADEMASSEKDEVPF